MRCLVTAAALMAAGSPALAQRPGDSRLDPASGDYFVWVMDDSSRLLEMRVVPPNKVSATVAARVERRRERRYRYVYTVKVLPGSRQPLAFLEIDCPGSAVFDSLGASVVRNRSGARGISS